MERRVTKGPKIRKHGRLNPRITEQSPQKTAGSVQVILDMRYKLAERYIMEAFRIRYKKSIPYKIIQLIAVLALMLICAFLYLISRQMQYITFMLVMFLVYGISLVTDESRIQKATRELLKKSETYSIKIYQDGSMETDVMPKMYLRKLNMKKQCFETADIFFLKISSRYSICIPKEFLEIEEIRKMQGFFAQTMECVDLKGKKK